MENGIFNVNSEGAYDRLVSGHNPESQTGAYYLADRVETNDPAVGIHRQKRLLLLTGEVNEVVSVVFQYKKVVFFRQLVDSLLSGVREQCASWIGTDRINVQQLYKKKSQLL